MEITMKQSKWMWCPGDFELYHGMLVHNRRTMGGEHYSTESGTGAQTVSKGPVYYSPMWRVDAPHRNLFLYKVANLEKPEDVTFYANTEHASILVDGVRYPSGATVTLKPGRQMVKVFAYNKNLGYFGAVKRMMREAPPVDSDFVIISNVDVVMDESALVKLCGLRLRDDIGWIAPQIYSTSENRDRNPKIVNRYSLRKLRLLRLLFKYPLLNMLYKATLYKRKKLQTHVAGEIYGGHGSFIILTKEYYKRCGCIDYPVFLFGEEIYLAEQCLRSKLKVVYEPEVRIVDSDHASTGKMPSRFYCKCNAEALGYIIRTFY